MQDKQGRLYSIDQSCDAQTLHKHIIITQIAGVGSAKIIKTARSLNCQISEISVQSSAALLALGWTQAQVDALRNPLIYVNKIVQWLQDSTDHRIVCYEHTSYPSLLQEISQPPLVLFCKGNIELLKAPSLAVVGSRNISREARLNTEQLISDLAYSSTLTIVSGLALGVDALAHQQALNAREKTIAVLGSGIDVIYPSRHAKLYNDIARTGLLVSEFLPSVKPKPQYFPRRNRIISGLSLGTLVTEARIKSGSLVTANYAIEQNREVFAVPGNIRNPNTQGCHWLIKQGATLVDDASDILHVLGENYAKIQALDIECEQTQKNSNQSLASDPLLDSVDYESTAVDLIAQRTGMLISDVLAQLLEYELRGLVASTSEGYIKLGG